MDGTRRRWTTAAVIALMAVAYHAAPRGEFMWDDVPLIVDDARLGAWSNAGEIAASPFWSQHASQITENYRQVYRPVVGLAYLAQWQLFGSPVGFHMVSLVLHTLCIWLLGGWLTRRVPAISGVALFAGLAVFALHPSRVESVAWISGSTDLWMTSFVLLACSFWARRDARWRAVLAGLWLGLAILSKEPAVVVPALWLLDGLVLEGDAPLLRPWLIASGTAALFLGVRLAIVPLSLGGGDETLLATAHRAIATLGQYVLRVVYPWPQTAFPALRLAGEDGFESGQTAGFVMGCVVLFGLLGLGYAAARRHRVRGFFCDAMWFVVPLVPTLNIHDTNAVSLVSDRMLYLPMVGVAAMISRALSAERLGFRAKVLAVVLAVLGIGLTVAHVPHFRSARALWEHELAINPSNLSALETLAEISSTEGDYRDAFLLCQRGYEEAFRMRVGGRGIRFALCQTRALLALTPDGDADTLNMIREVYDRLFASGMLEANADVLRFRVGVRPDQQPALLADPETLLLPRARAHLRTGHYESALSQLDAIGKAFPDHPAAQQLRDDARNLVKRSGSQPREP